MDLFFFVALFGGLGLFTLAVGTYYLLLEPFLRHRKERRHHRRKRADRTVK